VKGDLVLRVIGKLMIPFMLLFALYVQFHGDFGPGGGFQAGVISAAAVILYGVIYGLPAARAVVPDRAVEIMIALGVLHLRGSRAWPGSLLGGNLSRLLRARPRIGCTDSIAVFCWVEFGVLVSVSGVMLKIFYRVRGARRRGGLVERLDRTRYIVGGRRGRSGAAVANVTLETTVKGHYCVQPAIDHLT
jgi:multicomponent Na+:H+ antiporter subunit B